MIQIAMNNKVSNTTKISSYFVNFGKKSNLFEQKLKHVAADLVMNRVKNSKTLKKIFRRCNSDLKNMLIRNEKKILN